VAEQTKASVLTHTDVGSNLGSRAAFFFGKVTVSRRNYCHPPPGHSRYPQVPTKNAKTTHVVTPTVLSLTNKQKQTANGHSCRASQSIKKKKIYFIFITKNIDDVI